jgi:hypothetical protein
MLEGKSSLESRFDGSCNLPIRLFSKKGFRDSRFRTSRMHPRDPVALYASAILIFQLH